MKHVSKLALAAALGLAYATAALADDAHHHAADGHMASKQAPMSEGEVRKVDKEAGKITIKHGPLVNLGMPGMTMAFRVQDPAMLTQVKAGDKIRFVAHKAETGFVVTKLEAAK